MSEENVRHRPNFSCRCDHNRPEAIRWAFFLDSRYFHAVDFSFTWKRRTVDGSWSMVVKDHEGNANYEAISYMLL